MSSNSIITNMQGLVAHRSFEGAGKQLAETQNRVSTGLKVQGAVDDASNFAISQGIRGEIKAWAAVQQGLGAAKAMAKLGTGIGETITNILGDLRKKAVEASNPALTTAQRQILQEDVDEMLDQITQAADSASFNGFNPLRGTSVSLVVRLAGNVHTSGDVNGNGVVNGGEGTELDLEIQSGDDALTGVSFSNATINGPGTFIGNDSAALAAQAANTIAITNNVQDLDLEIPAGTADGASLTISLDFTFNGVTQSATSPLLIVGSIFDENRYPLPAINDPPFNLLSSVEGDTLQLEKQPMDHVALGLTDLDVVNAPDAAVTRVSTALETAVEKLGVLGAFAREVDGTIRFNEAIADATEEGLGNIVDADMAREAARLTSQQVRQQLAQQTLTIAKDQPNILLNLFV